MSFEIPSPEATRNFVDVHFHTLLLGFLFVFGILFRKIGSAFFARLNQKINRTFFEKSHHRFIFLPRLFALHLEKPLSWITLIGIWLLVLEGVTDFSDRTVHGVRTAFQALVWLQVIRIAYIAADATGSMLNFYTRKTPGALDSQLAPLLTKTIKVLAVILGTLLMLQNLGVNVVSLVAGLGIGGLAIALAAQDTCANLLGSVTIIMDRPFQIGDYVRIGDAEGIVEEVGFRSTRIRTPTKTLMSIPNSTVMRERIDNAQMRNFRRMKFLLYVSFATPLEQSLKFRNQVEKILIDHPKVSKDGITVRLNDVDGAGIKMNVLFFVDVHDSQEELRVQEEILFLIFDRSEDSGVAFSYGAPAAFLKRKSDLSQVKNSL